MAPETVDAAVAGISPAAWSEAARTLGAGPAELFARVHVPPLRPARLTAATFVFADAMTELPATLAVGPVTFATRAIRTLRLALDGRLEGTATAVVILAVGILPLICFGCALNRWCRGGPAARDREDAA